MVPLVVDEQFAATLILVECDDVLWAGLSHLRGNLARELEHRVPIVLGLERHDNVQSLATSGLDPALEIPRLQDSAQSSSGRHDVPPCDAFAGIDVEDHAIRALHIRDLSVPRVQLDDACLNQGDERRARIYVTVLADLLLLRDLDARNGIRNEPLIARSVVNEPGLRPQAIGASEGSC